MAKLKQIIFCILILSLLTGLCQPASANFFSNTYNLVKLAPKLNLQTIQALENLQRLIPGPAQIARISHIAEQSRRTQAIPSADDILFIKNVMPEPDQINELIKKTPTKEELNAFIGLLKRFKGSLPALAKLPKPIRDRIPMPTPAEIANIKKQLPNPKVLDLVNTNFPTPMEITYLRAHALLEYQYLIPTYEELQEWQKHIPTGYQIREIIKYLPTPEEIKKIKS
ncbi:MAG: hypothetical protein NT099_04760 [Candidatus Saganbacteria bacterium]|nr:hypothetical protein [Candidatus Saganbacteria bacterium]